MFWSAGVPHTRLSLDNSYVNMVPVWLKKYVLQFPQRTAQMVQRNTHSCLSEVFLQTPRKQETLDCKAKERVNDEGVASKSKN